MSTKKIVIGGIIVVIAVITIVGSIGIVMSRKTVSPSIDATAPNPTTLESLDIAEFGVSLNYDAQYGDLTYAISDNEGTPAKIVTVTNASLTAPEGCPTKNIYMTVARFVVSDTTNNTIGSYIENGDIYAKVGDKYVGYLGQEGQVTTDNPCYDKTSFERWQAQQSSISESFNALKTNSPVR